MIKMAEETNTTNTEIKETINMTNILGISNSKQHGRSSISSPENVSQQIR